MEKKHEGFTLLEHEVLGTELQEMRDRLVELSVRIGRAYGKTQGRCAIDSCVKAYTGIDNARSELDNIIHREHPDTDVSKTYYRGGVSQ